MRRTVLFDTGPEELLWELNAKRLDPDLASIEVIHLSHWHRDHSGMISTPHHRHVGPHY
jgi:7,8-dihydropterin-6-yl-methyl-4-(beta-D-ribofuranosyl)aminobenzene 5'-phosphate synthase